MTMTHDDQPMDELEQAAADEKAAQAAKAGRWGSWLVYGVIAAVVLIVALCVSHVNKPTPPSYEEVHNDAKRACEEQFIPPYLKAPASAKFSGDTVVSDGTTYKVAGSVDSQNSFGALIRSSFTCTMHSSGDTWVLDSASVS
jgi:hypothetical protein